MLLHHFFERTADRLPNKVALVVDHRRVTYAELSAEVKRVTALFQEHGIVRGDRIALFLDNSVEFVASVFAALKIGAVFMPVNALTKQDKLAYLLDDSGARAVVVADSLAAIWQPVLTRCKAVKVALVVSEVAAATFTDPRCIAYQTEPAAINADHAVLIDQDLASIIYTSGSTGAAKGVMLTHLNMVSAARSVSSYLGMREDDVVICVLPLAFDYGLYQVLMSFKVGATVVLEQSFSFPLKILERMAQEQVTVFPGVPTIFSILMHLKGLDRFDLSALRMITNTAAALSESHITSLRALFPAATLFSMYGLTECKRVTYLPPEQLDTRPTSVGRGMPNEEVWLVDESGNRLPNGSTGELVIRGSNVMRGYWNKPHETAERLKPLSLDSREMVLYSGDIFRSDSEGWLFFVARKDDIIKSRGEKVSPREVENVLYSLAGVQDAAVIGVDDALLGQAVKAFVVLREGATLTEREVIRHCLAKLENFMAPKTVEFVLSLPKTDTGKINKTGLR